MAQECGFFNAELEGGEYDRVYNAEQFAAYFASFIGNGVFGNSMSELVVVENETPNMSVGVSSGKAWINGWWYRNTEDYNLSVDVADGVLNRIDIVVLRWGNVERDMWLQVIKGTPSAEPTAPSITRDADYYDLKLCEVSVPAGAINIRQAQITDTRAISDVCGFVTGLIDQIDATDLFLQFQAQFGDFMNVSFEEFDVWFQHMKDQLSEDAAGHLQQEIDELAQSVVQIEECTEEEYQALTPAEKMDGKIRIVGDQDGQTSAAVIKYDNTQSGMSARNVQGAIDKINADLSDAGKCVLLGYIGYVQAGIQNITLVNDSIMNYKRLLFIAKSSESPYFISTAEVPVDFFKSNTSTTSRITTSHTQGGGEFFYNSDTVISTSRHNTINVAVWAYGVS